MRLPKIILQLLCVPISVIFMVAPSALAKVCGSSEPAIGEESTENSRAAARIAEQKWYDYQIIMWHAQTPERLAGLAKLGVTAGKIFGQREQLDFSKILEATAPFLRLHLQWFIENIATDFYSPYHRWHPDHPVN